MVGRLRDDNRPLYIRAEEALRTLIQTQYGPGDRLPPETQLAGQLGISRATLREAMRTFEERGLIVRRQGVGTFITEHLDNLHIESGLETLESLDKIAARQGVRVSDAGLSIRRIEVDAEIAAGLDVPEGTPAVEVARTKVAGARPVAHMVDIVPESLITVEEMKEGFRGSVLDFLLERGRPPLAYARARLHARRAGRSLSKALEVSADTPILLIEETIYSMENTPVEYSLNYFLSGVFDFSVIRRIG